SLNPRERCTRAIELAFLPDDALHSQRDLALPFERDEQHAAGAHHLEAEERRAAHDAAGEIERSKGLVGPPLPADEAAANLGDKVLDELRPAIARVNFAVPVHGW